MSELRHTESVISYQGDSLNLEKEISPQSTDTKESIKVLYTNLKRLTITPRSSGDGISSDINSNQRLTDGFSSLTPFSFDRHYAETQKIVAEMAFRNWVAEKLKKQALEAKRRRQMQKQKLLELRQRSQLTDVKYKEWLHNKNVQRRLQVLKKEEEEKSLKSFENQKHNLSTEEIQQKIRQWEKLKWAEAKHKRLLEYENELRVNREREVRQQLAKEAFERWLRDVDKKPKPVPLNRGLFTLRGSVSYMYVNPNEWQS
ncbi:coiled-coil domain-containing protein 34-like [Teleopsis dalmanni]|uniref:coiled-coil domain-containing protein 34-like n=1 Tax=Teleopsis dalmanni TaxID=139649 RepID=UPI0018CEFD57|nr:coiled-coil domain-containing protein 34-like [Teleopsis dalmanni]